VALDTLTPLVLNSIESEAFRVAEAALLLFSEKRMYRVRRFFNHFL
jgi:hypothetical protein